MSSFVDSFFPLVFHNFCAKIKTDCTVNAGHLNAAQNSLALKEKSSFAVHIRNAPVRQMAVNTQPSIPQAFHLIPRIAHIGSISKGKFQSRHPCPSSGPGDNGIRKRAKLWITAE